MDSRRRFVWVVGAATAGLVAGTGWYLAHDSSPVTGDTVFGSTVAQQTGESRSDALQRIDTTYGPVPLVRVYEPHLPAPWRQLRRDVGDAEVVVSFKAPPPRVLAGDLDSRLTAWFAAAPTGRDTYWVYFHEPEDDVESGQYSPSEFRAAWEHIARLAEGVRNPRLRATVVLMCYTVNPASGRDYRDYVPAADLLDVLAWDCYSHGSDRGLYTDPDLLLGRSVQAARDVGADWGVAELGARLAVGDEGRARADWLSEVGDYTNGEGATFVTYFDSTVGGDFRLADEPSILAWQRLVLG